MTLNQKAALQTVAVMIAVVGGSAVTTYVLSLLGPDAPAIAGITLLLSVLAYLTFHMVRDRLEYTQKLEELNQK